MKFTVFWAPIVERDLAEIWLASTEWLAEITRASNEIDTILRRNPETVGESRFDNMRFLYVAPLAIDYRVSPDDLRVEVIGVTFVP